MAKNNFLQVFSQSLFLNEVNSVHDLISVLSFLHNFCLSIFSAYFRLTSADISWKVLQITQAKIMQKNDFNYERTLSYLFQINVF